MQQSGLTRTARLLSGLPMNVESKNRQDRRSRESQREDDSTDRTRSGRKPFHVNVNWEGKPYGSGVTVWNDALAKCVRGLDPSYVDIRQQPHHNMEILMKRLDDDFEYSSPLNPSYLRQRIGNALSSYRHEIIRLIQAEQDRPPWVSATVWGKLVKLEGSDKFRLKSAQMKHANACRKNKGRTGPLGEAGITERLRLQLQRSPTADEIYEEMTRDKGYGGRSRKAIRPQSSKSQGEQEDESLGNMHEDSSGDVLPQLSPSGDVVRLGTPPPEPEAGQPPSPVHHPAHPPVATTDLNPECSANPLLEILERQIQELRNSPVGDTEDGKSLILTLICRLDHMRARIPTPTCSEDSLLLRRSTVDAAPDHDTEQNLTYGTLPEVRIHFILFLMK